MEEFPDDARSIFLITKIYEIVEGREQALKILAKYTDIKDLSDYDKRMIAKMETKINNKNKMNNATTGRIRTIYLKKEKQQEKKEKAIKEKCKNKRLRNI